MENIKKLNDDSIEKVVGGAGNYQSYMDPEEMEHMNDLERRLLQAARDFQSGLVGLDVYNRIRDELASFQAEMVSKYCA